MGAWEVRKTCLKVGGVRWERPSAFGMLQNTSETFKVMLKCLESNIEVRRCSRVFGVCLWKCEWWLCPYEASCDVFSELGPVGGPITVEKVFSNVPHSRTASERHHEWLEMVCTKSLHLNLSFQLWKLVPFHLRGSSKSLSSHYSPLYLKWTNPNQIMRTKTSGNRRADISKMDNWIKEGHQ
jgi:hypothetical protein